MESRAMGIGDGVSGSLLLWTVVVASLELELGVEMKAGYIIVVVSSSFSSSSMSKLLLVVVTSLASPFLWVATSTSSCSSCSSNFLLLPSGILFRPRRPGFLPSRLPAPCLLSSLPTPVSSRPTGSLPRPRSTLTPPLLRCSTGWTFLLSWLL